MQRFNRSFILEQVAGFFHLLLFMFAFLLIASLKSEVSGVHMSLRSHVPQVMVELICSQQYSQTQGAHVIQWALDSLTWHTVVVGSPGQGMRDVTSTKTDKPRSLKMERSLIQAHRVVSLHRKVDYIYNKSIVRR